MALTSGATHTLQWAAQRVAKAQARANLIKAALSADWRLQPAAMKPESLVIADQHAAMNTFPGLVHTARHVMEAGNTPSRWANSLRREAGAQGGAGDWDEVVTR